MDIRRGIKEWYHLSRTGSRGSFLKDIQTLTCDSLITLLKEEIATEVTGRSRTKAELDDLNRVAPPNLEALRLQPPREQTLQWLFIHRRYLYSANEMILYRELPTCYANEAAEGRADLLAFDNKLGQPILVELKSGTALDPLSSAVVELLYHWAFHTRHINDLNNLIAEFGCTPTGPCRLVLIAPQPYFDNAKRRSHRRHQEFERAIRWIEGLAVSQLVSIELWALDPNWQRQGVHMRMQKVRL